jgi:hypothetical protein
MEVTTIGGSGMGKLARESVPEVQVVHDAPVDSEEFGLRINWQSEEERIEAAEFLLATRMQEDVRRRIAKKTLTLRTINRENLSTALKPRIGD